jgi:anti-sigma regulatory factor (Ser/Thr protein kinase)
VHKAREFVAAVCDLGGFSEEREFAAKVAVSEACANGIEHAHSGIAVVAWLLDDRVLFEVTNDGPFLPGLSQDTDRRRRGLGIPLMAALADQIHISRLEAGLTRVSLTFFLSRSMELPQGEPEELPSLTRDNALERPDGAPGSATTDEVADLLEAVAAAPTLRLASSALLDGACRLTGCEGGMLRMRESLTTTEGWLPAIVHRGLSASFLEEEALIRSEECMCGRVCMGLTDAELPFFTRAGSFLWGRAQSIAEQFPPEALGEVRGRCIGAGFESIAIFPLTSAERPLGVLHLVDFRPDRFAMTAATLEWLCRVSGRIMSKSGRRARSAVVRRAVRSLIPAEAADQGAAEKRSSSAAS